MMLLLIAWLINVRTFHSVYVRARNSNPQVHEGQREFATKRHRRNLGTDGTDGPSGSFAFLEAVQAPRSGQRSFHTSTFDEQPEEAQNTRYGRQWSTNFNAFTVLLNLSRR